jgi:hypothetical protein
MTREEIWTIGARNIETREEIGAETETRTRRGSGIADVSEAGAAAAVGSAAAAGPRPPAVTAPSARGLSKTMTVAVQCRLLRCP